MFRRSQPRLGARSASFSRLGQFFTRGRSVDRALEHKRGRRLGVETLEDRRLLAADIDTNLTIFEPHVAVSPANPAVVAASQFNQIVISTNYGQTFGAPINATLPPALAAAGYGFGGDSVLAFNAQGTLFWSYLGTIDTNGDGNNEDQTVIVQRVNPLTGAQIGNSVDLSPGNFADDKQWIAIDDNPSSPFAGNIYVAWPRLDGNPDQMLFSRSIDGGVNFSAPALISDPNGVDNVLGVHPITLINDDEEFVWPSHVETAANGDLYVAYHIDSAPNGQGDNANGGPIVVLRSSNGGVDFAAGTVNQKTTAFAAGAAQINDNTQTEAAVAGTDFWMQGAFAPYVLADPVRPGRLYVIGNDDPNNAFGNGDEGDVVLTISTDNGLTWSAPTTISHGPAGTLQVFPIATIDELGNIAVFWYDNRSGATNAGGNFLLDLFATSSRDGGLTFSNDFRVNDVQFDPDLNAPVRFNGPPATTRIGEYNGIAASQGVVHLVWTGNDAGNGQQEVFYDQFNILGPFADAAEENDSLPTATILGSVPKITIQDATLDVPTDVDFYKFTATKTGKLIVNAFFSDSVANLRLRVFDSDGPVDPPIAVGTQSQVVAGLDLEGLVIPVVSQEEYWIEVSYDPTELIHNPLVYDLEIENFAAPAPSYIDLTPGSDTGMMNNDDITSDTTPTFLIQADLVDFRNMGITLLNQAVIDPNNDGDAADATDDGAGVYVSVINLVTGAVVDGFANQVGASGFLWTFTSAALTAGEYFVSTAVQIVDGQQDPNRENGRAQLSEPLILTIIPAGGNVAAMVSADMIAASDTGMFNNDNVTNKMSPAFNGIAPVGSKVRLFANGELVGQTVAGTDASDVGHAIGGIGGAPNDGLGLWEITSEPLADDDYNITLEVEDAAGNVTVVNPIFNPNAPLVDIIVDTLEPNTPLLDLLDDTGRHNNDSITKDNTPQVSMTTTDPNIALAQLLFTDNLKFRIFDRFQNSAPEVLIYDSAQDPAADAVATAGDMFTALVQLTRPLPVLVPVSPAIVGGMLANGVHNLKLEVEDRAGNISHDFLLQITVDTATPPVSFGLPDAASQIDGLTASSDSGVATIPASFADRVTSDSTPRLWGRAEADSIVRVFLDRNNNGAIDLLTDTFLGQTVAVPVDGNVAYPEGYWEIDSALDLNEIVGLPRDGVRRLLVTAEDVAGNPMPMANIIADGVDELRIFIDTQGARVTTVEVNARGNPYDLFNPKPITDGPTPPVNALVISVADLPNRSNLDPNFLYGPLVAAIAANPGHYVLKGDHSGVIPIERVVFTADPSLNGFPATGFITLVFASPLPDDRYTLSLSESLVDPAGNLLDGESNAVQPLETPAFPSGDGLAGGEFRARFTVDSRPEIGTYAATSVYVDANGNFVFDPEGQDNDFTNRDLAFNFGATTDGLFAGNFSPAAGSVASGFAQFGAYGFVQGAYRFRIDLNHNGRLDPIDLSIVSAFQVNAAPVAGNFDNNALNGDEIGLFDGTRWLLDSNHDHILDAVIPTVMRGFPIVGDFNGDGADDLGVYDINLNHFTFDLDRNGTADDLLLFGFAGISERPLAADFNLDGIDDLVLWVPDREGQPVDEIAEWYVLNSDRRNARPSLAFDGFAPIPLGNDQFAQLGDTDAEPLVGNFDPPPFVLGITPPTVEGVFVRDNRWSSTFLAQLDAQGLGHAGAAHLGYLASAQSAQMHALPWAGLNTITIAFSEDVRLNSGHLTFTDEIGNTAQAVGFVYDPALRSATWTLAAPFLAGEHTIRISDSVVDTHGIALDGEWMSGAPSFASGNGVAGGDFVFQVDVSPTTGAWQNALNRCDVNHDGNITPLDALIVINRLNNGGAGPLVSPAPQFSPSVFYDVNGDDKLTPLDALIVINVLNRSADPQAFQAASGAQDDPVPAGIASANASDSELGAQANSDDRVGAFISHHVASRLDEVSQELALVRYLSSSSRSSVDADDVPRLMLEQIYRDVAIDEYNGLLLGRKRKLLSAVTFVR